IGGASLAALVAFGRWFGMKLKGWLTRDFVTSVETVMKPQLYELNLRMDQAISNTQPDGNGGHSPYDQTQKRLESLQWQAAEAARLAALATEAASRTEDKLDKHLESSAYWGDQFVKGAEGVLARLDVLEARVDAVESNPEL